MQLSLVAAFIPIVNILWCGASAQDCNYTSFLLNLGYSKECIHSSRSSLISCSNNEAPAYKEWCLAPENINNVLTDVKTFLQEMKSAEENSSSSGLKSLLQKIMSDGENSTSLVKALLQEMKSDREISESEIKAIRQDIKSEGENYSSVVKNLLQKMQSEIGNSVSEVKAILHEMKSAEENSSSVVKPLLQKIMSDGEDSLSVVKSLLQEMKSEIQVIHQEMKFTEEDSSSVIKSLIQEMKSERKNSASVLKTLLQEMKSEIGNSVSEIKAIRQEIKSTEENSSCLVKSLLQEMKSEIINSVSEIKAIRQEMKSTEENSSSVVKSLLQEMKSEMKVILQEAKQYLVNVTDNSQSRDCAIPGGTTAAPEGKELPKNCAELKQQGEASSGVQTVYPYGSLNPKQATVYCGQVTDEGGWTVIQSRSPLPIRENFTRNWDEYVQGFGDPKGEFWLGLDNIHALTNSAQMELRVDLEDDEGQKRFAKYRTFHVGDAASKYVLRIEGYSGDAGDAMIYPENKYKHSNGMKFSTFNNDNDLSSRNCAELWHGGWWFNHCYGAHLNGLPIVGKVLRNYEGIQWRTFYDGSHSMKKANMKIRPVSLGF